ncbi:hypothetical protein CMK19_19130 [Candidatus Poribacteria bacterium]|nr:hypothetical protein [Candidatus Poribacteria bacterium]
MNKTFLIVFVALVIPILSSARSQFNIENPTKYGLNFQHTDGQFGLKYFIEPIGCGLAMIDYDNDGDLDLYFVNGCDLRHQTKEVSNRFYRNDGGIFTDVTNETQTGHTGYGIGCCTGDYNNDGWTDLYLTNYGSNVLYKNNADGTFSDVSQTVGVDVKGFSSGCSFIDYDQDGWLDLYVVNYVQFDVSNNPSCKHLNQQTYCTPEIFDAEADKLYRNNTDGTFSDVSELTNVSSKKGKGLGVVCGDFNHDNWPDIFVANDTTPDFLLQNSGGQFFREIGLMTGVGLSESGQALSGMGCNTGDYDNDGDLDIIVTNFQDQTNHLFRNDGSFLFTETSFQSGIGQRSLPYLSWGVDFADLNNDGWLDIFIANGHLDDNIEEIDPVGTYQQPNQIFWNQKGDFFIERLLVDDHKVSRGSAFGDLDNDGDVDVVVVNLNDQPTIFRNSASNQNGYNWLTVKLIGSQCNRSAIGSNLTIFLNDSSISWSKQSREVKSGSGYASQNDLRLHFGLGKAKIVDRLEIEWASGNQQIMEQVKANQFLTVVEEE